MALSESLNRELREAAAAYDFPTVTFDFDRYTEVQHSTMREVEARIRGQLLDSNPSTVRDGLSNVLYWGHARAGYRSHRVAKFRAEVTDQQLVQTREAFADLSGAELVRIKKIGLPQFSQISFISKVRMFLSPRDFVTLDLKLAKIREEPSPTLLHGLTVYPTSIPVTKHNQRVYEEWSAACRNIAERELEDPDVRAVDVERAIFYLMDSDRTSTAAKILAEHGGGSS